MESKRDLDAITIPTAQVGFGYHAPTFTPY
jgi:hypothetical protein